MSLHAGDAARRARAGLAFATAALTLVAFAPGAQAATTQRLFTYTGGEQMFVVPEGLFSIHAVVIAGSGGDSGPPPLYTTGAQGGNGALVPVDIAVRPGQILYIEVGGNGGDSTLLGGTGLGGFNGGGSGGLAGGGRGGGGGGASDIRTAPRAQNNLASRLT